MDNKSYFASNVNYSDHLRRFHNKCTSLKHINHVKRLKVCKKKKLAKNIDQNALSLNSMTEIFEKRKGILIFIRFALTPGGKVNEIYKHVKYYILK